MWCAVDGFDLVNCLLAGFDLSVLKDVLLLMKDATGALSVLQMQ